MRFDERLEDFAWSQYLISKRIEDNFLEAVDTYLLTQVKDCHYTILFGVGAALDGRTYRTVLTCKKASNPQAPPTYILDREQGHGSYVFYERVELWADADGRPLKNADPGEIKNRASDRQVTLPRYVANDGEESRTSIILPLREKEGGEVLGLLTVESDQWLPYSRKGLVSLRRVAGAICRVLNTGRQFEADAKKAHTQVDSLMRLAGKATWQLFEFPIFWAYPASTDHEIRQLIVEACRQAQDELQKAGYSSLKLDSWEDQGKFDSVLEDVRHRMARAYVCIAYLSQPTTQQPSTPKFEDNFNVMCEVGMMIALTHDEESPLAGGLLIREKDSRPAPADLGGRVMTLVERHEDNSISNGPDVVRRLKEGIVRLIKEPF